MYRSLIISENPLDRVKLLMNYDMSTTKTENIMRIFEQDTNRNQFIANPEEGYEEYQNKGFVYMKTVDGKVLEVPKDTVFLEVLENDAERLTYINSLLKSKSINNWVGPNRGGTGNEVSDAWIPTIEGWEKIIKYPSVVKFKTPDGKIYRARYNNPKLEQLYGKTGLNYTKLSLNPQPDGWQLENYIDSSNNPYVTPKEVDLPWYRDVLLHIKRNWEIYAQVAASIIAGILSGGMSLLAQAAIQFGIDVSFAIYQWKGLDDGFGAFVSIIMGLVPVVGRLGKFGVSDVVGFLSRNKEALKNVKNLDEFQVFYEGLIDADKLLVTRAIKQTPGELKKFLGEAVMKTLKKEIEKNPKYFEKIPLQQMLWWKETFVEGGISLGTGIGLTLVNEIVKKQKQEKNKDYEFKVKFEDPNPNQTDSLQKAWGPNK